MPPAQNTIFSVSMLWFMVGTTHFYTASNSIDLSGGKVAIYLVITLIIVAVLEVNALGFLRGSPRPNMGLTCCTTARACAT